MQAVALIEKIAEVDSDIKKVEATLRILKAKRAKLEVRLLKEFAKGKTDSLRSGKLVGIRKESVYWSIKNRPKFLKYVIHHEAYDLFQNRVSSTALKERTQNGEKVPGVENFTRAYISVGKQRS